jgi:hypothetical protein
MSFSISLDFAAKGPHYEISPILALFASFRRRSPIWPLDRLLGHAVGVYHPRAAVKDLPQKGGWIGVATGVLEILQRHVEMEDSMRARMLTLVQDCELGNRQELALLAIGGHRPGAQ